MIRIPGVSVLRDRLVELHDAERLRYLGTSAPDGERAVEVGGQTREYPNPQMLAWLDGFTAAEGAARQPAQHRDPGTIAGVRAVLVNPSVTDQARILMQLAMQESGVGVVELAARAGITKKPVSEALRFGKPSVLSLPAVLGLVSGVRPELADADPDTPLAPVPPAGWREPDVIGRLRALGYAHEQGVVEWVGPTDVNAAMWARWFQVRVGDEVTKVHAAAVRPWLVGVADVVAPDVASQMYRAGGPS